MRGRGVGLRGFEINKSFNAPYFAKATKGGKVAEGRKALVDNRDLLKF